ncbi:hypothetical protein [Paraclostridium bifermentans]|uniref:hypothetical protein n=1 Tax=Paraclostridium bifermentans TaxID=1490 RepID=UPI00359C380A
MKKVFKEIIFCMVFIIMSIRIVIISEDTIRTLIALISGIGFTCILINKIKQSRVEN